MNFKKLLPFMFLFFQAGFSLGQEVIPKITWIPDSTFGMKINWEKHLPSMRSGESITSVYYDMAVAEDGRIFVIQRDSKSIYRFDAGGKYLGKFGGEGKKPHQFFNIPPNQVEVLEDQYVIVNSNQWGRIVLFNLNGEYLRTVKLDYPVREMQVLPDGRLAIKGWIQLSGGGSKDHIAIVDLTTGKSRPLIDMARKESQPFIKITYQGGLLRLHNPLQKSRTHLLVDEKGDILVGDSNQAVIKRFHYFDPRPEIQLTYQPPAITEKEMQEYRRSFQQSVKRLNLPDTLLTLQFDTTLVPSHHPYYYDLAVLPGNRLLAFNLHEGVERLCHVLLMDGHGTYQGKRIFEIEGYDPPNLMLMASKNGWMYALVSKTEGDRKNLRIIRAREKL